MAKNIVIAEGGTAKTFTAQKIQTRQTGSGTVNWVPEDEVLDYVDLKDKEFTANGEYEPSDFSADGFGKVTVNVPANVKEKVITANGTFYARDDNVMGYDKVTVNVPTGGGGGPFTVNFFNGETLLQTVQIPYDGNAEYNSASGYPKSDIPNQTFIGWNPNPVKVRSNMNCYAQFKDKQVYIGEIADDWNTIIAKNGADYPLGSYKLLGYGAQFTVKELKDCWAPYEIFNSNIATWSDDTVISLALPNFLMVKVAEGEGGTTSTWLSTPIYISNFSSSVDPTANGFMFSLGQINYSYNNYDYRQYIGRYFLNSVFRNHMADVFKQNIKPVIKYTQYGTSAQPPYSVEASEEYIWIPSVKEIVTTDATIQCCNATYDEDKYVNMVTGAMSYFREELPLTTAEWCALFLNSGMGKIALRDVTDGKGSERGSFRTPVFDFENNYIYNPWRDSRYETYPYGHIDTYSQARYFCFGFCL